MTIDIGNVTDRLSVYDQELVTKTGCTLRGVACRAAGVSETVVEKILENLQVGVVPITSGQGTIKGFCQAVAGIGTHLGCTTFVTCASDAAGLAEAFEKEANIILLADDNRFVAIHTQSRNVIDNAVATGKGFVAGLELMVKGLKGKSVLVIGCGPVGQSAVTALLGFGARVSVYDIDPLRYADLEKAVHPTGDVEIRTARGINEALSDHRYILDASSARDIIHTKHITPGTYISAPGMPLGLSEDACAMVSDRLLHDPLQIGVATMIVSAVSSDIVE